MRTMLVPSRGFTLVELVIAVAIVALLAAIAYPSFQSQVQRSRRAEARAALLAAAVQMQRYYTERSTFVGARLGSSGVYADHSENSYYVLALANLGVNTFTVSAAPAGVQTTDPCGTYTYTEEGVKDVTGGTKTAAECWK